MIYKIRKTVLMNSVFNLLFIVVILLVSSEIYADEKLIIVGESWPPYYYVDEGKISGIDVDVAGQIFSKLGVKHEFRIYPWKRCWHMLVYGKADVGISVSDQPDRSRYVYYPENEVWNADYAAFAKRKTIREYEINSLNDIKNKKLKVGIVDGNSYYPGFWEVFESPGHMAGKYNPLLDSATTVEQNFRKLEAGRIDIFIIPETVGLYLLKKLGLKSSISNYRKIIFSKSYPNVFSKKSGFENRNYKDITELMGAYDEELEIFKKTDEFKFIFEKYISD